MSDRLESYARESRLISFVYLEGAEAMHRVSEFGVTTETFADLGARAVFEVAIDLHTKGQLCDGGMVLFEECLKRQVINVPTLTELTQQNPPEGVMGIQLPALCRELRRMQKQRELRAANERLSQAIKDGDQEAIAKTMAGLQSTETSLKPRATWHQVGGVEIDRARAVIAGEEDPDVRTIPWPWKSLNVDLKPFRRGEQVVVAGYTSNGKSSLLRQLLVSSAHRGFNAAMVSLEVPAADIFNMMATAVSGRPWSRLKTLHPKEQEEFVKGAQQVRGMNIETFEENGLGEILAWVRNQHARRFLDVIAIDYLGLVAECSPHKGQTTAAAVGEVACAFKRLASELQCVLFLAVQINRGPTGDGNREPRLSDLKDSGDIEAHADRVLLLYRPDQDKTTGRDQATHEPVSDRPRFFMQLFQEKGRNVGTGSSELWLNRELAKFELI
jgi:replicative DNA helicase